MKQRVITAIALLALLAVVVWQIYTPLFIIVIAFLSAVAANEIMRCAKIDNKLILTIGTIVAGAIPFSSSASIMEPCVSRSTWYNVICPIGSPTIIYSAIIVLVYFLIMLKNYKNIRFEQIAIAVVASLIVPHGFAIFGMLRDFDGFGGQIGIYFIFYGLICALGTDVGAQLGGMAFGKHKMAPNISPKKTIEGAISGVITSFVFNLVAMLLYNKFAHAALSLPMMIALLVASPFVSFMGMMGDLTASVLKRNFDVKDFGKIFPGHGGVMDRFDSSLFTVPLTYCVVTIAQVIIERV